MRCERVPPGKMVAFLPKAAPARPRGEFVAMLDKIAALWRRNPLGPEPQAPSWAPERPDLRVVAGTDYEPSPRSP